MSCFIRLGQSSSHGEYGIETSKRLDAIEAKQRTILNKLEELSKKILEVEEANIAAVLRDEEIQLLKEKIAMIEGFCGISTYTEETKHKGFAPPGMGGLLGRISLQNAIHASFPVNNEGDRTSSNLTMEHEAIEDGRQSESEESFLEEDNLD